jgi:hypothetical protein
MIKKLIFVTALLAPSLACDANPNNDLSIQIVPAGSPPAVPAPALAAGFTTEALNADFTVPGGAYSNTATFINECGATTPWRFYVQGWFNSFGDNTTDPCSRVAITTDSGLQVLNLKYLSTDDSLSPSHVISLSYPGYWLSTDGYPYFPNETYVEITLRVTPASVNNGQVTPGPIAFWMQGRRSRDGSIPSYWLEPAGFERDGPPPNAWGSGIIDWENSCSGHGPPAWCQYNPPTKFTADWTTYHKLGILLTSDESTVYSHCLWLDDIPLGSPAGPHTCLQMSPTHPSYFQSDNVLIMLFGSGSHSGSFPNMDMYIKSFKVWSCANYQTAGCPGPVIKTQ